MQAHKTMTHAEINEEREKLLKELPLAKGPKPNWVRYKRPGRRVRTRLLRFLSLYTTGQVAVGKKFIAFEKAEDALIYRLKYHFY